MPRKTVVRERASQDMVLSWEYTHIYKYMYNMYKHLQVCVYFPGGSVAKKPPAHGDMGSVPGSGRFPREGNSNPLQYCCREIPRTEEPGGLQSTGSQRIGHHWSDLAYTFNNVGLGRQPSTQLKIHGNLLIDSPSSRSYLHIHGFVIHRLNHLSVCNPVVSTVEKDLLVSGPMQFKPVLFKVSTVC